LMRPPYSSTPAAATVADLSAWRDVARSGYLIVLADRDTDDWKRPGVSSIVKAATPAGGAGAIVLMHDGGGDRSQTVAALRVLIPKLQQQGYRFTTVSDAIGLAPAPPAGAVRHWQGVILRVLQQGGGAISTAMIWVLLLGLALGLVRLPFQVAGAMVHQARQRRRQRLRYLGGVSVIVPAYNEAANIAATVRSLYASDYPHFEIIVVDDGSTDATTDIVRSLRLPDVRVIRQPNAGKPTALNTGIAHARYQLLVLVDGDTIFEPDALGRLIQPLADRRVGAVSGNTKVANRGRLLGRWQHLEYVIGFNLDRRLFDVAGCMPTVPGAIGAFRRDAIADVGGVSDQTLAEDTDLTIAVGAAGWRIVYVPDAIAHTEAPSTLRQLWRQRYRWCYGTMQAMWKHKHAIGRRGPAGRMGRRGLSYLLVFQVVLPLAAPAVDVYAIYGLVFLPVWRAVAVWAALVVVQMATAAYALRLDGERMRTVWALPLQQFVYRQLMYLVVVQSTVMALLGDRLRWHRMHRTGAAAAAMPNRVPTRR
jgi:glycosyltransferase involved in cell wall biosynthesis